MDLWSEFNESTIDQWKNKVLDDINNKLINKFNWETEYGNIDPFIKTTKTIFNEEKIKLSQICWRFNKNKNLNSQILSRLEDGVNSIYINSGCEVDSIFNLMRNIACSADIPGIRRMDEDDFEEFFDKAILLWENAAKNASKEKDDLEYYDYSFMYRDEVKHNVVLGTPAHKIQKKKIAFNDTRTSLREVESQTAFGEKLY